MLKKDKLLSGATVLAVGGFLTKAIGAVYRIPLTNILGAEGIGVYQMVFPLYCLLLTFSSTGVPNGIAKLIGEGNDGLSVLKSALKAFSVLGLIGSGLMAVFSYKIAVLHGNSLAYKSYLLIAPSVFLVSVISCFRGYYQGLVNMKPTAVSQVLEQLTKLLFGLTLAYAFKNNPAVSASMAALAVSISELIALIYLALIMGKGELKSFLRVEPIGAKTLLKNVVPITLSTLIMPLTRTVESFLIFNILNGYLSNATSLYGLYSGAVESLVGLPVSVLYSIAVASVPIISKERGRGYKKIKKPLIITVVGSVIFAILFYLFAGLSVKILYRGLSVEDSLITVKMVKLASLSVLTLPIMQTLSASLIASGSLYVPSVTSLIASIVKIILSVILLNVKSINIFALLITDIICYLVACFLNLVYIIIRSKN